MSDRSWFQINRDLLVYKAFYFFFLSGFGSIFPYLPVYFRQIGLPASQVGLLLGLRPIVQLASAPFWAIMADKYRKRKSVLVMSVLSWLVMTMALAFVEPTNELCEIRQGNDTHQHVVNYTKVKTGFFRRSLWHQAKVHVKVGNEGSQQPDLDVVPIHISSHGKRRYKTTSSITLPAIVSKSLNRKPQLQLAGITEILSHDKTTFTPRNASFPAISRGQGKEHQDIPSQGGSSSLKTLSSNRKVNETLMSKNNTQWDSFYNKRGPKSKTRTNNALQTATSKDVAPSSEQIISKHLSRFYTVTKSAKKNYRRKHISKNLSNKTYRQRKLNSKIFGGKPTVKVYKIAGENVTSNLAPPAKNTKKNDTSSIDKRRENKGSPPVVIEFSRIIIPHSLDKSTANSLNDDSGNFTRLLAPENLTKFVSHKTVLHSNQSITKQVDRNMSDIFTHINKQSIENINNYKDNLLQLEEKLSKIVGSNDLQKSDTKSNPLEMGNLSDPTSIENQVSSSHSVAHGSILQIHVNSKSKNTSLESGKLSHLKKLNKLETQIVMHNDHTKPGLDIPVLNASKFNVSTLNGSTPNDVFLLEDSSSGSGSMLLGGSSVENKTGYINRVFDEASNEENNRQAQMKGHERLLETADDAFSGYIEKSDLASKVKAPSNESLIQTLENLSGTFQASSAHVTAGNGETTESNFLQESQATNTHPVENSESRLHIWMTNLLKTNSFELKRIFTILLVLVVVGEFLEAPSTTLADASLLEHLGEERRYYGKQRLWGSLGFGLSSFFVGVLLERSRHVVCGDQYTDYMICFCVFALLMLTTLFISTTFKFKYKETDTTHASVLSALCNIHYGSCLVAACFMGVDHGMSHSFLNWFLEDLGATKTLMGVAVICRSTFDLLTFFVAGSLIKAFGQIKIMICALISYGIAFTLYSLLTNPWWVLPIEMLVGCTYAASWSACTSYMAGAAPSESVTTIQGNNDLCH